MSSLIYIHLLSVIVMSGKDQNNVNCIIIGGQIKKCRKIITTEQKFNVIKLYKNNEKHVILSMLPA
jgi:hypothetical protein